MHLIDEAIAKNDLANMKLDHVAPPVGIRSFNPRPADWPGATDWRVPVFDQHFGLPIFLFRQEVGMMFKYNAGCFDAIRFKYFPNHVRILVNDGGKWNGINYPSHLVLFSMMQSEAQAGKCFASACGNCQGEDAFSILCFVPAMQRNTSAKFVDGFIGNKT